MDINKMRDDIADYIHLSMCVDGFVKFDSFITDEVVRHGKKLNGMLFEVTDKKRGTFYIAWLTVEVPPADEKGPKTFSSTQIKKIFGV